jgi:hypothetical protein
MVTVEVTRESILSDIEELEQNRGFTKQLDDEIDEQIRLSFKIIEAIDVMREAS